MSTRPCDYCKEEPEFAFIIIDPEPGRSIGARCLAGMGLEVAREVLTPEAIWGVIGPMFVEGGGQTPAPSKSRRRPRKGEGETREESPGVEPSPEGVAEAQTSA
jgi:hypothetical protein